MSACSMFVCSTMYVLLTVTLHSIFQIWVRNYQILEEEAANTLEARHSKKLTGQTNPTHLVEIGPRFVLNTIRIFRGSFGGQTIYQNAEFVSPNEIRAQEKRNAGNKYEERKMHQEFRKERNDAIVVPEDPLANVFDVGDE